MSYDDITNNTYKWLKTYLFLQLVLAIQNIEYCLLALELFVLS